MRIPLIGVLMALAVLATVPASSRAAEPCDEPVVNEIACENSKPGSPKSYWDIRGIGDPTIQGYATSMSVTPGATIRFKVKTDAPQYRIEIFRLGWYQGHGARLLDTLEPSATLPQMQPDCLTDASTGLIDCGNWAESFSWSVPADAVSGVYMALMQRDDTGGESQIPFVVRDDSSDSDVLVQTSDATWQAYNAYGGNSLYGCTVACPPGEPYGYKAAYAVSYNRPFDGSLVVDGGYSYLWHAEYQLIRWLERNGYDVSYTSQVDVDRDPSQLLGHDLFVSSGHDEYWSGNARVNVEAARDAGVNLAFFSGNEVFWKTRYAPSGDGSATPHRTVVSYKETHFDSPVDPAGPSVWTGTWVDPRWSPPGDGGRPPNALTGQLFLQNRGTSDIKVPARYANLRMWRNTQVAGLQPGETLTLASGTGTLGYEWDEDVDNGHRPAGLFHLSSTTVSGTQRFTDYGTVVANNSTGTHNLTLYRAPSGALVFGSGTVQWSWGLDDMNAWSISVTRPSRTPLDPNMQQATVNLFADMRAQPSTLQDGLVLAGGSTDAAPPASTITDPAPNAALNDGDTVTISGTATDAGGGIVAGVEVSTDGGVTWHRATGTSSWTYEWAAHGNPSATLKARAVDDSGNLETSGPGVSVSVACGCSLWGGMTPDVADAGDTRAVELGVKFRSDSYGTVNGIRFYKAGANTGTHIGSLWTAGGQRLAQVTFTNETASGWQEAHFSQPVPILPNTTYIASYFAPRGHFAATQWYLMDIPATSGNHLDSPPLHAVRNEFSDPNGVYAYSSTSTFPSSTYNGTSYWVDVDFTHAGPPGRPVGVSGTAGTGSVRLNWTAGGGGPATEYVVTPYIGDDAQPTTTVSGSPAATTVNVSGLEGGTTYTFSVKAINPAGESVESVRSAPVTPRAPVAPNAPTDVVARSGTSSAQVTWTGSSDDGGSPMTGYVVTPYAEGNAGTPVEVGPEARAATVGGLANGTSYTFKVAGRNAIGTGAQSAASNATTPGNTIFDFTPPAQVDSGDTNSVVLGVRFKADTYGLVTGLRFYKSAANVGTHVGTLWTEGGTALATATFTNESPSGWQQVDFSQPVAIEADTTYVATYLAPKGRYSATPSAFSPVGVDNPPLHALADGTSPNGVYAYSKTNTFPVTGVSATSYSVDVMFTRAEPPGQVGSVTATGSAGAASVSWTAPASGGPVKTYTLRPYAGGVAQQPITVGGTTTSTVVRDLEGGVSYTFTVQASNPNGAGPVSAPSNAVTPGPATVPSAPTGVTAKAATRSALVSWIASGSDGGRTITGYTITPYIGSTPQTPVERGASATSATISGLDNGTSYTFRVTATNSLGTGPAGTSNAIKPQTTLFDFSAPAAPDSGDRQSVVVGLKFRSDVFGTVTGVRFYKATANTGAHVGSIWKADGTLLASATFTGETESGWQQADFANPVNVDAGSTYVVSYLAPRGRYSATSPAFAAGGVSNPPLHALANATSPNGVYVYSQGNAFPTNTFNASNYWIDVLFAGQYDAPGQVTNVSATAGNQSATVNWSAPSSGGAVTRYTVTPYIGDVAQEPVTLSGSPPATSTTITGLTAGATYTFRSRASNPVGDGPESAPSNAVTPSSLNAPSTPINVDARSATQSARVTWTQSASNGGSPITAYRVTPYVGATAGTPVDVAAPASAAIVTGLMNGTSYTFRVSAVNAVGESAPSAATSAVTPRATILDFAVPATADSGDTNSVVLGMKLRSDVPGTVTGLRFYKSAANTGVHVGTLWTAGGTALGTATWGVESASGWQQVNFPSALPIAANTTYVISYLAPKGRYSATGSAFTPLGIDNGPLHALANSSSANGVYAYSKTNVFPTSSWNAANYWVDVQFAPNP